MEPISFVQTAKDRCRVCFTCVRECPAKAIRILEGQAEVIPERCVGCGNCVRVCSQEAKQPVSTIDEVEALLASDHRLIACIAPSFPADFYEYDFTVFVGLVKGLGFDLVTEVAFGADLVADRYRRLVSGRGGKKYIAANCPAVVGFVERYYPHMIEMLSPVVSPMAALGRALHQLYGPDYKSVFIGPCIAKKNEVKSKEADAKVEAAITFKELREMFVRHNVTADNTKPSDFDIPHPRLGTLLPISRGFLQAASISEDLMSGDVVAADGLTEFVSAIDEYASGNLDVRLLEILSCNGCIMGAGMGSAEPLFRRRARISDYARYRISALDRLLWRRNMDQFAGIDLTRTYQVNDQRIPTPLEKEIRTVLVGMGKSDPRDELNCGACGYHTCREHAIAICKGIAESEMCLPYTIEKVREAAEQLTISCEKLEKAQEALIQSEKLASMGQLAAGIAHEVNNPLQVVLLYANILKEKCPNESDLSRDIEMIMEQTERCRKIVGSLLNFARKNRINRQPTDIVKLLRKALSSIIIPKTVNVREIFSKDRCVIGVDHDQMLQVLTNLMTNAFEAMPDGGIMTLSTSRESDGYVIGVEDSGIGMSDDTKKMIFEPFFTTKKIGKGMGLGLAVAYGIIKMHSGSITVESNADSAKGPTGTRFMIRLPCDKAFGIATGNEEIN